CAAGRLWGSSREEVLQRILPSTVQIVLERDGQRFRSSSGVLIAARRAGEGVDCYVLTSGHTLARLSGNETPYVLLERHHGAGTKLRATVIAARETDDTDLGLLRVSTTRCPVARIGAPPTLGQQIWVVAFPWGRNMTLVGGIISQVNQEIPGDREGAPRSM